MTSDEPFSFKILLKSSGKNQMNLSGFKGWQKPITHIPFLFSFQIKIYCAFKCVEIRMMTVQRYIKGNNTVIN